MVTGLELCFWWIMKPMEHHWVFLVNKTAHTYWWPWLTSTFTLKAAHIEHGLESKRGWSFYTILQRKFINPLMLSYLWVLSHLKIQGSSSSSAGDWKLASEVIFQRIPRTLCRFWLVQSLHMKQCHSGCLVGHILTLEMKFLTFYCKNISHLH